MCMQITHLARWMDFQSFWGLNQIKILVPEMLNSEESGRKIPYDGRERVD